MSIIQELKDKNLLTGIQYSNGFIAASKDLLQVLGDSATLVYTELLSKKIYFRDMDKLQEDGTFYFTAIDIMAATGHSEKQQTKILKKLEELNLIKITKRGIPATRYFYVNEDIEVLGRLTLEGRNKRLEVVEKQKETYRNRKARKKEQEEREGYRNPLFFKPDNKEKEEKNTHKASEINSPDQREGQQQPNGETSLDQKEIHSPDQREGISPDQKAGHSPDKRSGDNKKKDEKKDKNKDKDIEGMTESVDSSLNSTTEDTNAITLATIREFINMSFNNTTVSDGWFNLKCTKLINKNGKYTIVTKAEFASSVIKNKYLGMLNKHFNQQFEVVVDDEM